MKMIWRVVVHQMAIWIFILTICYSYAGRAQSQLFTQYKFHRLNESDGLENTFVNDILQDSLGQVWVATEEGLYRYHGFGFQQFIKRKSGANALHNNYIEKLFLDENNKVWVMTEDGVAFYSYADDVIKRYLPEHIKGRISSMAKDERGTYYFGEVEGGVGKVENGKYSRLNLRDAVTGLDINTKSIFDLVLIGNQLWATVSDLGVFSYHLVTKELQFYHLAHLVGMEHVNFYDMFVDYSQNIWIPSKGFVFRIKTGSRIEIDTDLTNILPADDDYLSTFRENGTLWIGSRRSGLFKVHVGENYQYDLMDQFEYMQDEQSISTGSISKILKTSNGLIWLGNHNSDINVFDPNGESVRLVTHRLVDAPNSLTIDKVWGLANAQDGNLWVGLDGRGISKFDLETGHLQNNFIPILDSAAILCVNEDARGRLWVGTYSNGLILYQDGKVFKHFEVNSPGSQLTSNDIRCIYETSQGQIFVGSNSGGLYTYDESSGQLKHLSETTNLDIRSLEATDNATLWLGTYGKGLLKFNLLDNTLERTIWQEKDSHVRDVVFGMVRENDRLYLATRQNSVVIYNFKEDTFLIDPSFAELSGRSVFGIEKDLDGNLWMTSNNDVRVFERKTKLIKTFGSDEGFQSGHFNYGSILRTRAGFMAIGGVRGLNLFSPEELIKEAPVSKIVINQLKIAEKVINPVNSNVFPEGKSIFLTNKITLDFSDNIFSFRYSRPGYSNQKKNDFVYMLSGYEKEWQVGAESNVATYRNVPPGNYNFKVRSVQGNAQAMLQVVINPPIWKTWYAYLVYLVIIVFVIWRMTKFNNSRIALKQKLKFEQELREKEAGEMQEKLRFYTNFSHELKTPLTLIQGPVNDLLKTATTKRDQKYLQLIKKNTGIILKFINRMLEFRKIEINKTILNVGLHDLKILAQEEAESFSFLARDKGVKFGFYSESDLYAWVDLEKMQIVLNNLLSNALKFTPEGKSVQFGVLEKNGEIHIEIKDEGVGIKKSELNSIFSPFYQASNSAGSGGTGIGLALSKSFIEMHQGTIEVESSEGKGTHFTVKLPTGRDKLMNLNYVRFIEVKAEEPELIIAEEEADETTESDVKDNERMLLIVDDNKDILSYVESLFEEEYRVVKAENGLDAYQFAINNTPDIIISDLMMPGMNGIEFCEKVKNNVSTSHVPVIMLTAKDSTNDKIKGFDVGADEYITKPFSSDILIARVNNLLKNREMLEIRYESTNLVEPGAKSNSREIEFVLNAERITMQMLEQSDFSVPDLCKELGMSQSALYRKIKTITGVSIQVFIRKIRIKRAAQLLVAEDMTVSEIAFSLEFSDLKYFRKCFKEQFGVSPSEYRVGQTVDGDQQNDE